VTRTSKELKAQNVSNIIWSLLMFAAARGVPLPGCYPSLWRAACGLDVSSFDVKQLASMFHAHLMHTELVNGDGEEVGFPGWMMHEAREAWLRDVRDNITVSRNHREVASILKALGVRHEMEHLTADAYFSVDLYLPDHDVAIEVDGPSHYIRVDTSDNGGNGGNGGKEDEESAEEEEEEKKHRTTSTDQLRRTLRTEVRDMFLARRHRAVVTVPWFELKKAGSGKKEYIADKLRAVGVEV